VNGANALERLRELAMKHHELCAVLPQSAPEVLEPIQKNHVV
jgi:hypothetical protein